ncbi:hypothetical protein PR048_010343 [Dryococelus australis]|uniref:Uncharacterized protein n=1 Tax=Dryococelus australis TaxID=614101 RepID=A0ABQ9I2G1_9NEOP|nr:hypothetical protein PR048_010343 [Dryococelus australis]
MREAFLRICEHVLTPVPWSEYTLGSKLTSVGRLSDLDEGSEEEDEWLEKLWWTRWRRPGYEYGGIPAANMAIQGVADAETGKLISDPCSRSRKPFPDTPVREAGSQSLIPVLQLLLNSVKSNHRTCNNVNKNANLDMSRVDAPRHAKQAWRDAYLTTHVASSRRPLAERRYKRFLARGEGGRANATDLHDRKAGNCGTLRAEIYTRRHVSRGTVMARERGVNENAGAHEKILIASCSRLTLRRGRCSRVDSKAGTKGRGKRDIPEKTRRLAALFGTIATCENPGEAPPEIEPGSPKQEASSLATTPPRPSTKFVWI